ncbi:hypothetical protein [Thermosulfurimonas sp. F29]|uniref:InlB B-repeat-containing protein n=1 Tax=Thermosulfurimonas sp. F29 TaxID=2867247 RepID=UPI001C830366|nr:hypothetical protein [Thermosulfurimonas sp. F29]MBX6423146.1 hypothetical protein [Thermosulfurimonas sp. F29]
MEQDFLDYLNAAYDGVNFNFISENETKNWPYNEIRNSQFVDDYYLTEHYNGAKVVGIIQVNIDAYLNGTFIAGILYSPLVSISISGNGSVLTYSNNLSSQMPKCVNKNCEIPFPEEDNVVLTAVPANGYLLAGWGGDCAGCGKNTECTITMDADRTCNATFVALRPDISVSPGSYDFGTVRVGQQRGEGLRGAECGRGGPQHHRGFHHRNGRLGVFHLGGPLQRHHS